MKNLKRFAVITWLDTIFYEDDDVCECQYVMLNEMYSNSHCFKGIYDYERCMYLTNADILAIKWGEK